MLGRLRSNRRTPVLARLADGSYLSVIGTVGVQITVPCVDGITFTGSYRLVTPLTDARRYPAAALSGLYHQPADRHGRCRRVPRRDRSGPLLLLLHYHRPDRP
ncbi:hypothetical protein OG612_45840 (plasmid) [Streptomyces sp. NBC_01527]|uniref:hypothetical protein n=1 Tax=Streptomyces sp. NBC_01527 TaxID=2903894 RepID=UPI002F9184C2